MVPEYCEQSYHMFYMLMPDLEARQKFIEYLRKREIYTVFHYIPLHTSRMGEKFGYKQGDLPITESTSDRLVRLPFYNDLKIEDQDVVINTILQFGN